MNSITIESAVLQRPNGFSVSELNKAGVRILDAERPVLACVTCGQHWQPNAQPGGRFPRGYWKCPTGCNHGAE